jgi:predicted metal-dependent enzyme (double-stranded beta helix superfamily)
MTYTLEQFCADTHAALDQAGASLSALEHIGQCLERLLRNQDFVAATFQPDTPAGKRSLYHDAKHDFHVLAHVQTAGKSGSPHSHGSSWAIYGNAAGVTSMTEYRRLNPDHEPSAVLEVTERYDIGPGQSRVYPPDMIHSTAHPEKAWVIRITGTDLDVLPRYHFKKSTDRILEPQS